MDSVSVELHSSDEGNVSVHLKAHKREPLPDKTCVEEAVGHPEEDNCGAKDKLDAPISAPEVSQHEAGHGLSQPAAPVEAVQDNSVVDNSQSA